MSKWHGMIGVFWRGSRLVNHIVAVDVPIRHILPSVLFTIFNRVGSTGLPCRCWQRSVRVGRRAPMEVRIQCQCRSQSSDNSIVTLKPNGGKDITQVGGSAGRRSSGSALAGQNLSSLELRFVL